MPCRGWAYVVVASLICTLAMAADAILAIWQWKLWFPNKFFTLNASTITLVAIAMKLPVDLTTEPDLCTSIVEDAKVMGISFLCCMKRFQKIANTFSSNGSSEIKEYSMYVVQIEEDAKLTDRILRNTLSYITRLLKASEKKEPRNLTLLLERSTCFNGVVVFENEQVKPLYEEENHNCWSLVVVTLTSITIALPNIAPRHVKLLLSSMREGLQICHHHAIEKRGDNIRNAAELLGKSKKILKILKARQLPDMDLDSRAYIDKWRVLAKSQVLNGGQGGASSTRIGPSSTSCILFFITMLANFLPSFGLMDDKELLMNTVALGIFAITIIANILIQTYTHVLLSQVTILLLVCPILWPFSIALIVSTYRKKLEHRVANGSDRNVTSEIEEYTRYVVHIEEEMKLSKRILRNTLHSITQLLNACEEKEPHNLMKLLSKSTGFNGVVEFDNDQVPPLYPEKTNNCRSLVVVTLTAIAISLPNIANDHFNMLLSSMREGLQIVRHIEECLNADGDSVKARKSARHIWTEVEMYYSLVLPTYHVP
ncbi:hypothetical protein L1987_86886 [Smallanthus sonchifolius]|uniref:Uncharacterized protein n=1 Tax=Smallanthus sonchifolius TaxID=185202 RepID=A0ACB8Y1A8_9ASTR|nr:hypothetical protein L1987_86886 [Smallanthus sonchifolius]